MATTGNNLKNPQLPKFNGKNYYYWDITMRALFASQDIWELVEQGFQEPADATTLATLTVAERDLFRDNKKKDSKSIFYLYQAVQESIFPRISATTKSMESCDILKTTYQGMEKVNTKKLQMLRRDFETLCMKESDNINSFFTRDWDGKPDKVSWINT